MPETSFTYFSYVLVAPFLQYFFGMLLKVGI